MGLMGQVDRGARARASIVMSCIDADDEKQTREGRGRVGERDMARGRSQPSAQTVGFEGE